MFDFIELYIVNYFITLGFFCLVMEGRFETLKEIDEYASENG